MVRRILATGRLVPVLLDWILASFGANAGFLAVRHLLSNLKPRADFLSQRLTEAICQAEQANAGSCLSSPRDRVPAAEAPVSMWTGLNGTPCRAPFRTRAGTRNHRNAGTRREASCDIANACRMSNASVSSGTPGRTNAASFAVVPRTARTAAPSEDCAPSDPIMRRHMATVHVPVLRTPARVVGLPTLASLTETTRSA